MHDLIFKQSSQRTHKHIHTVLKGDRETTGNLWQAHNANVHILELNARKGDRATVRKRNTERISQRDRKRDRQIFEML